MKISIFMMLLGLAYGAISLFVSDPDMSDNYLLYSHIWLAATFTVWSLQSEP